MNRVFNLLSVLVLALAFASNANASSLRLLNTPGDPIPLGLITGQEVELFFDGTGLEEVGVPLSLKDKIHTQSIDSRLWITAKVPFDPTRVLVKDSLGNINILLLSAKIKITNNTSNLPVKYQVVTKKITPQKQKHQAEQSNWKQPTIVDLTRFAAQTFYAPERLVKPIGAIRVPIDTTPVGLFVCSENMACNGNVEAMPMAAWRSQNHYVSAVMLKNQTKSQIMLDPRDLQGRWKAATFQFNRLGSAGLPTDISVVYLISVSPFGQSLN